jgi:hypothetical protein
MPATRTPPATHTFYLALCACLLFTPSLASAQSASAHDPATAKRAFIYPFASATAPAPAIPTPSTAACPAKPAVDTAAPDAPPAVVIDPKLAAAIAAELQKKLSKKFTAEIVTTQPNPSAAQPAATPAPRTLLFAGCITTATSGNTAERMAGFGLGASHLDAHVIVQLQTEDAATPHTLTEFDIKVKGSNLLPPLGPIGLVTHAVMSGHKTLTADAKKLADEILKTFAKKMKESKTKST